MQLEKAIEGMIDARTELRSRKGITDPFHISEQMQRLAQFTGAIEEHLAEYEEQLEIEEYKRFSDYTKQGRSINQAEILAKQEVGELKGKIARLKRYVNSSWQIIGVAQSRFNHIQREGGIQT